MRKQAAAVVALGLALCSTGCEYVQDRLRSCRRLQVTLVNRPPEGPPVHIAREGQAFDETTLIGPAQTHSIEMCVEPGDLKRFRAGEATQQRPLGEIECGVVRETVNFEVSPARVVWDVSRLYCENW